MPPAKQRWPFIRERRYKSGKIGWLVDARTATGGAKKIFATKLEAETYAGQCRIRRGNEGTGAFESADLARFGKTVQDAISFYLNHLRREERSIPLEDAISELIAEKKSDGTTERYQIDLAWRLGRLAKAFSGRSVATIGTKELAGFLAGLGVAPGTRNTFRRDIRTLFSFCERVGYCASDPASKLTKAKDVGGPVGILTPAQARSLLEASGPDTLPYTAIGLFAGLRSSELQKLDWAEIHWESMEIEVTAAKSKTASHRLVKIEPVLAKWLKPLRKASGPVADFPDFRRALLAPRLEAGLAAWPKNALRHSFGTYWMAKHKDAAACALQMGNSVAMIFAHYRRPVKAADAAAFWSIEPDAKKPKK